MNTRDLTLSVRAGFPVEVIDRLCETLDTPRSKLLGLAGISSSTLSRRKRASKAVLLPELKRKATHMPPARFNAKESGRIYRIIRTVAAAERLFEGDQKAACQWLKEPASALGGSAPLDYLDTEAGADAVHDLIGQLEHGVVI